MINTSLRLPTKSIPKTWPNEKEVVVMGCPIKMILSTKEIIIYNPPTYRKGFSLLKSWLIMIYFFCKDNYFLDTKNSLEALTKEFFCIIVSALYPESGLFWVKYKIIVRITNYILTLLAKLGSILYPSLKEIPSWVSLSKTESSSLSIRILCFRLFICTSVILLLSSFL